MRRIAMIAISLAACCISACGGGGGGGSGFAPSSTPPPPPPPPATEPSPFGVKADTSFATVGDDVEFRWLESAKAYEIRFPGKDWERLTRVDAYYPPSSLYGINLSQDLDYQYTNMAGQFENGWGMPIGLFAYGIPTAQSDMPLAGTASYEAIVRGRAAAGSEPWAYTVDGTAKLQFDFGVGTLSGSFDPALYDWNGSGTTFQLGNYDFVNTIFGAGSTGFSGELSHADTSLLGSFNGLFTGPGAAELMSEWTAPYRNPSTGIWDTMSGVWIGKRDN